MKFDFKLIFAVIAIVLMLASFIPYVLDILKNKTKPHIYTWIIWLITQGTATLGLLLGHGGWGTLLLLIGTFYCLIIVLLAFKFGTKNITKFDTIILLGAFAAIIIWWQLKNPLLAVFIVSIIDVVGYIPSYRKTYQEPWTETLKSWELSILVNVFSILALSQYNLLTTTYLVAIFFANITMVVICIARRRVIPKSYE